jgi:hypothetical protein
MMRNPIRFFSFSAALTGCGILVSPPGNLHGDVLVLLDSARVHPVYPNHDYLARPDSIVFDRAGETRYQYRCTSDHSRGGMGPNYGNVDLVVIRKVANPLKVPVTYIDEGAAEGSYPVYSAPDTYDSLPAKPRAETAYQTAFRDDSGKYVVVYRSEKPVFTQVYREGLGLVYDGINSGSGGMDSDWRKCVLTRVNNTDFDAQAFLSKLVGMYSAFADSQRSDSTLITVRNCRFDSLTLVSRIGGREGDLTGLCSDTAFRFLQSKYFGILGYGVNESSRYFPADQKVEQVKVEGLQIDLVAGARFYHINF